MSLRTYEQQFLERLGRFQDDAVAAARFTFLHLAFRYRSSRTPSLVEKLDTDAGFWNSMLHALQMASAISIGRVFDDDRDARSARYLLDYAADHYRIFSRQALARRKGPECTSNASELTPTDFSALKTELAEHAALFEETIGPLRDKAFAHSARVSHDQIENLFGRVRIEEYQRLAVFGIRLHQALFDCYYNGRPPELAGVRYDIGAIAARVIGDRQIATEPEYVVKETLAFLDGYGAAAGPST
jgi:hypothetical protein